MAFEKEIVCKVHATTFSKNKSIEIAPDIHGKIVSQRDATRSLRLNKIFCGIGARALITRR